MDHCTHTFENRECVGHAAVRGGGRRRPDEARLGRRTRSKPSFQLPRFSVFGFGLRCSPRSRKARDLGHPR